MKTKIIALTVVLTLAAVLLAQTDSYRGGIPLIPSGTGGGEPNQLAAKQYIHAMPVYDSSDYASINVAVTAIGATECELWVTTSETLTASLTVPATCTLRMFKGGLIIKASTYTLTINGSFEAGLYQVFSGFTTVTLSQVKQVYPEWFGSISPDATLALQAAVNSLPSGGKILFQKAIYTVSTAIECATTYLTLEGTSGYNSMIASSSSNILHLSADGTTLRNLSLYSDATGGHTIQQTGNMSYLLVDRCWLYALNTTKSIWDNQGYIYIDNKVTNSVLWISASHTVPAWNMVVSGGLIASNTWERLRCEYSGNYFFWLEDTLSGSFVYDSVFRDITFEVTNGGNIRLLSSCGAVIENCTSNDNGTILKDLFVLGQSIAGSVSSMNTIRNSQRRGGTLNTGIYDINLLAANRTLIENYANSASTAQINVNGQIYTVLVNSPSTLLNKGAYTVEINAMSGMIDSPTYRVGTDMTLQSKTVIKTIDLDDDASTDDYQFDDDAANATEQVITLSGILPARATLMDWQIYCIEGADDANTVTVDFGTTSGGSELGTGTPDDLDEMISMAAGASPALAPTNAARSLYVGATPSANWNVMHSLWRIEVVISYIDNLAAHTQKSP